MQQSGDLQTRHAGYTSVDVVETAPAGTRVRQVANDLWRRFRDFATQDAIAQAAGIWLATRIAFIILTYYIGAMIVGTSPSAGALLQSWQQFDGNWYIQIATRGYDSVQPTAFFPLYPMLITALTWVLGSANRLLAAMIIANLGSLLAFVGISLLAVHEYGKEVGPKAARMLAAFPLAFFLFAPYTDGLFTGLAALTFLNARRGNWLWAVIWGFLAGLSRPTGLVLVPALFWEFGRQHGWWQRAFWREGGWKQLLNIRLLAQLVVVVGIIPLSLVLFMAYTWYSTGHPLATFNSHREFWNRHSAPIWETLITVVGHAFTYPFDSRSQSLIFLDLGSVLVVAVITLVMIRKQPLAFTLYTAGLLYLSLYSPEPSSPVLIDAAGRFMLPAIPVFMLLGKWVVKRPSLEMLFLSVGFMLQAVFAIMFITQFHILVE